LWNWFDSESWYPLGRSVGGTVYPGLMSTSAIIYWTLNFFYIPVEIRNVCVFLAPVFAGKLKFNLIINPKIKGWFSIYKKKI